MVLLENNYLNYFYNYQVHCDKIDFEIMMILCPSLSVGILRNVIFFHDDIMDLSHLIVLECSFPCCYYNIKTQFQYTPEGINVVSVPTIPLTTNTSKVVSVINCCLHL